LPLVLNSAPVPDKRPAAHPLLIFEKGDSMELLISAGLILAIVLWGVVAPDSLGTVFDTALAAITRNFGWFYLWVVLGLVVMALILAFSRYGDLKLGQEDDEPEFSIGAWFAMLFAAGMGIGLVFWGVAEPISHYGTPPPGIAPNTPEAANAAMRYSFFHWGLHPWAVYAIVALALGLFAFNKGLPLSIRSIFYPILGERVWGWPGHIVDILAVFATLFGLVTSLGLGAEQAAAGVEYLFGIPATDTTKVLLIVAITLIALASVVAGLDKGVKRLSEINMGLAMALLLFIIIAGPTLVIFTDFFKNLGAYLQYLPALSNPVGREDANFSQGWTAFYWAWWISWSPFVGMFIARVSRGRSVREFLVAVLLVPSLVSVLWMTAFGGTAINQLLVDGFTGAQEAGLELKLFSMLGEMPLTGITSFIGIVLVVVFFITSSDSGSLVIDTITAGGKVNAPVPQRVFWASIEGVIAIALLLGGGLVALQAMAVSTGLPFTIVLLVGCISIVKGLMSEPR